MARSGLTRAVLVTAAADIADAQGLDAVTFARLAQRLGVKPPSLYNHVENLPALLDALMALALTEMLELSRGAIMGRSGWDALAAMAHTQRAYAGAHPGRYAATFRSLHVRAGGEQAIADAYLELFLAALRSYGLHGPDALHTVRCLRAAIGGFIELETRGGFGMKLDIDESFRRLLNLLKEGIQIK